MKFVIFLLLILQPKSAWGIVSVTELVPENIYPIFKASCSDRGNIVSIEQNNMDTGTFYVATSLGTVAKWSIAQTQADWSINLNAALPNGNIQLHAMALSPNGKYLAVIGSTGYFAILDAATGTTLSSLARGFIFNNNMHRHLRTLNWSNDGEFIAVGDKAGLITVWSFEGNARQIINTGSNQAIKKLYFSPDGRFLTVVSKDDINIWRIESATHEWSLRGVLTNDLHIMDSQISKIDPAFMITTGFYESIVIDMESRSVIRHFRAPRSLLWQTVGLGIPATGPQETHFRPDQTELIRLFRYPYIDIVNVFNGEIVASFGDKSLTPTGAMNANPSSSGFKTMATLLNDDDRLLVGTYHVASDLSRGCSQINLVVRLYNITH